MSKCRYDLSEDCNNTDCLNCVLDKIRAEIEALPKTYPFVNHFDMYVKEDDVRKIIDKYKAESVDKFVEKVIAEKERRERVDDKRGNYKER